MVYMMEISSLLMWQHVYFMFECGPSPRWDGSQFLLLTGDLETKHNDLIRALELWYLSTVRYEKAC